MVGSDEGSMVGSDEGSMVGFDEGVDDDIWFHHG